MRRHPAAGQQTDSDRELDLARIASLFQDMADGFNARDVTRADQHFASDAVVVAPDGRRVEGLDALLRYHQLRFAGPASTWQTAYRVLQTTFIEPGVAIVHTAQDTTTATGRFRNHGTFVLVDRDDAWWIAASHNTNVEGAPAPSSPPMSGGCRTPA